MSAFAPTAAHRAAEDALLAQAIVAVSPEAYAAFQARLDAPPEPNERLRRSLRTPLPWDRK